MQSDSTRQAYIDNRIPDPPRTQAESFAYLVDTFQRDLDRETRSIIQRLIDRLTGKRAK
jgi:hypothetical protein